MWVSAPTERLPIESHIALHGRRSGFPCLGGQHKRGARRGCRRRDDSKARHIFHNAWIAWLKCAEIGCRQSAERIPKPWVLAAFFPPFLSPQKEREPPEARRGASGTPPPTEGVQVVRYRRATARVAPTKRNRKCVGEGLCPSRGRGRTPAPTEWLFLCGDAHTEFDFYGVLLFFIAKETTCRIIFL